MELQRKFYRYLLNWKAAHQHECLLVRGARQIGKTYIIEKFARENYTNFIALNFAIDPTACEIFEGSLTAEDIYRRISAFVPEVKLIPGETMIFLDEIQECANARTALKPLALDGRYDVVATGSLLGIKYKNKRSRRKREPRSIPVGYERSVMMYALDFEEFLWAKGVSQEALLVLRGYFERKEPVPDVINRKYLDLLREYLIVGGMPAVVKTYAEERQFGSIQEEQEKILTAYIDDIHKYADTTDVPKIENCYRAIPRILSKENHKFKYADIEKGGSERKFGASVGWLIDASLALKAEDVSVAEIPLAAHVIDDRYKLYLSDVGLLSAIFGLEFKRLLFSGQLTGNAKGGLYENFLAAELKSKNYPLSYFKTENGASEIEYVLERDGGVVPVEVKAGNGATISLNEFLKAENVPYGYKFIEGNVGKIGKKVSLPHYMAMFI
ncbi:MAG: ATP-binding protein [Kiritimatiellae bacterium]|nr:ATP-binding protein [Kiritimatiellia bacterium]